MDSDYDRKFEEMKKYIPFLESMIKRLETASPPSANPRQAQLDKIRSLRDLLQDKKKRMKMDNLLKCEQVLVNLYAKVEQRDTLPGIKKASEPLFLLGSSKETGNSDLNTARNKLKSVVTKKPPVVEVDDPDTLPEIARASETEVVCVPGSKEPALFQRRPNKASKSPSKISSVEDVEKKSQKTVPKRNYTRVLVSPEPSNRRWSTSENLPSNKPLYSRRSPRKSPNFLHKKEKKKSSEQNKTRAKDLNITLNVPEESLSSLNTGNILSRIIECPDNDVDIDTLRDLKAQILSELKHTGANEDISDLILKSYKKKKKSNKPKETEEGELSDSESEAIQNIYGSLVVDKVKNSSVATNKKITDLEKEPRKVQISLVINSDKDENCTGQANARPENTNEIDLEMFDVRSKKNMNDIIGGSRKQRKGSKQFIPKSLKNKKITQNDDLFTIDVEENLEYICINNIKDSDSSCIDISSSDTEITPGKKNYRESQSPHRANFYKPLNDQDERPKPDSGDVPKTNANTIAESSSATITDEKLPSLDEVSKSVAVQRSSEKMQENSNESLKDSEQEESVKLTENSTPPPVSEPLIKTQNVANENMKDDVEIPLLNTEPPVSAPAKKSMVSEIEILQALKNDILSESIAIPGADVATPLLHQPKVTKVASGQAIMKKRISIEKYKEKSIPSKTNSLFLNEPFSKSQDSIKKTSLKLTEEEQQRFKNILPLSLGDSSDEDNNEMTYSIDDIYSDLAPKSPEHEDETTSSAPPIIIPVDPVKSTVASSRVDVDMRTLVPILSPNAPKPVPPPNIMAPSMMKNISECGPQKQIEPKRPPLMDPRMRRDLNNPLSRNSPNPHSINPERTPRAAGNFPNMTPNMTPSHQPFDMDDESNRKHVYAPVLACDLRDSAMNSDNKEPRWEPNTEPSGADRHPRWDPWKDSDLGDRNKSRNYDDRDYRGRPPHDNGQDYHRSRYEFDKYHAESRYEQRDDYSHTRIDRPRTPVHPFGRSDCTNTNQSYGRVETTVNPYGRKDCPSTPIHPFGRSDCPTTPSHPFGRSDNTTAIHAYGTTDHPMTPTHSFGRSDAPMTPVHPFGRSDIPRTPNHPFGRSDAPMTPSHPFGRSDAPMTPSHPFGRSETLFGRSEAPMTPSHPFGRTDTGNSPLTPNHPFGRSDAPHNTGPKVKDPRLNRTNEYDSNTRRYDNDQRGYYKDRRSDGSKSSYNNSSDSYRNHREQSIGRSDGSGHNLNERKRGREGGMSRDFETDRLYSRDRGNSYDYRRDFDNTSKSYEEVGTRRDYQQRAQSVGRSGPSEERCQQVTSRLPHDHKNDHKSSSDNTLSVIPQTGRSFTIDTSVNTTFQEFLNVKGLQVLEYSFEDRRRRATSVGRTLTRFDSRDSNFGRNYREGSVGRTLTKSSRSVHEDTLGYKTMVNFVRARSMGRELLDKKSEKSFKEVKADLVSYRDSYSAPKKISQSKQYIPDPRSRRDQFDKKLDKKWSPKKNTNYSPRKNYRDPRMNRGQNERNKKYEDKKKTYGIVYSNDNIAKGTILGSGYGVKNYKIPKIKRPIEEPKEEPTVEPKVEGKKDKVLDTNKHHELKSKETKKKTEMAIKVEKKSKATFEKRKEVVDTKIKPEEISNKRSSRSSKTDKLSDEESIVKTRKTKKAIIDSDSDSDTITKTNLEIPKGIVNSAKSNIIPVDSERTTETKEDSIFNSSFGIDDLDVFPENIASDPVLSNINDLIADLDKEIGHTKDDDFNKDDAFDKLLDKIDSPEVVDESLNDISEVIKEDLTQAVTIQTEPIKLQTVKTSDKQFQEEHKSDDNSNPNASVINELVLHEENKIIEMTPQRHDAEPNVQVEAPEKCDSEGIVSTTELDTELNTVQDTAEKVSPKKTQEVIEDRSSTPDSTINTSELQSNSHEHGLPDSTIQKDNINSDVSSILDHTGKSQKDNEFPIVKHSTSDSIGSLLSILQDKSKIKELLNLLGDQSGENQRIKKKLEKISTIVLDDDDDNYDKKNYQAEHNIQANEKIEEKEPIPTEEMPQTATSTVDPEATLNLDFEDTISKPKDDADEKQSVTHDSQLTVNKEPATKTVKPRKGISKKTRKGKNKRVKSVANNAKRLTRSAANLKANRRPRELKQLEESLKEMGSDMTDLLNDTGIRSCRLAKMFDEKPKESTTLALETQPVVVLESRPVVFLEKFKQSEKESNKEEKSEIKLRKKPGPKPKPKPPVAEVTEAAITKPKETKIEIVPKYKPGPKSKKKVSYENSDPYSFDDSVSEATTTQMSEQDNDSGTDSESITSSKSFGSSEVLADMKKKPKRKRRYKWNSGIISSRKRKKTERKPTETTESSIEDTLPVQKHGSIPDMNCFTDKSYCFLKNVQVYPCRLCDYTGIDIVKHYKTEHPHAEIPLSRMHAVLAREAIQRCEDINFQAVSKMPTEKYVCRFCYEEFGRKKTNLEEFFWHVVSTHTGEYKQLCSECVNVTRCPFNLDIPPPPKDLQGQLIGYICGKCHFTQISLENLKMHVIVRHNDEQTAVYTINLAVMSKKTMIALMKRAASSEESRMLRSSRSNASLIEPSDTSDHSDFTANSDGSLKQEEEKTLTKVTVQSKLLFEPNDISNSDVKVEEHKDNDENSERSSDLENDQPSTDILDYPHFKIYFGDSGSKEYVCCINGKDNHYKTTLIISMKRHVQTKHSEVWDGYCSVCKVIVMPQGQHNFKQCLQHMLDNHMDNFPVLDQLETENKQDISNANSEVVSETGEGSVSYINVRPLSDLITPDPPTEQNPVALPIIESVVSLGATTVEPPRLSPAEITEPGATLFKNSSAVEGPKPEELYKYEEWQAEVMAKKHLVILDAMLSEEKLVHVYKCAGRYCSFTTDSADLAVLHASTHKRVGGENALICAYCDFDCKGNAIDLVMHVFKVHGRCKYVCGQCFYRAVASQLVVSHMHRVHGSSKKILETVTATPQDDDLQHVLPREIAVQYYVCADVGNSCKFKTYTQGKFIEHLQKHGSPYMCSICVSASEHPTELLQHLKTHGLKLYQCTWCLSGADNEPEFLAHSSARHPTRQPQAYLRIITSNQKGGVTKTMVLPLVKLNKSSVATQLVDLSTKVDDPVREAERALDLEKIITSTSLFGENKAESATVQSLKFSQLSNQPSQNLNVESDISLMAEVIPITQPRLQTPPPSTSFSNQDTSILLTPILKTESDDTQQKDTSGSNVICLDSDDDDSPDPPPPPPQTSVEPPTPEKQNVIDVSDDEHAPEGTSVKDVKKVNPSLLYKCKRCQNQLAKPQGFKNHILSCYSGIDKFDCAHCSFTTGEFEIIFNHYQYEHGGLTRRMVKYQCDICQRMNNRVANIKAHMKKDHNISNFSISAKNDGQGGTYYTVSQSTKRLLPKRKLSGGPAPESIPKRVRYGPDDLFKLPQKPILDELTYCSECEFSTKVRLNLVRHIQLHAENQSVPQTAPVNPVPHLETNEKHFDRMINLAASSVEVGRPEKATPTVTLHIPPEAASRYPKYVPERQRHTCGAKGCSYTSVDEAMLKYHWETLHSGVNDFHCVHCPPYQYLDTSKPLTSVRIIAHLKMHDVCLYACSSCTYYHYRKQVVEKHLTENHQGAGQVMIVREESTGVPLPGTPQVGASTAPTMDLKPWQCGLCAYKSMLRPEVVDHCSKTHNTKMQFKCPICPFRTSTIENVEKHKSNAHPGNNEKVFYYYYREGSISDEPDGTPRWVKQRQKMGNPDGQSQPQLEPEVKTETPDTPSLQQTSLRDLLIKPHLSLQTLLNAPAVPPSLNMTVVKQEIADPENEDTLEFLCSLFGEICDPNGLKYKCPLCKLGMEDNKDDMQSHLFEELQYRKWGCSICSYKAFHKTGLNEHILTEHRQNSSATEPKELPIDTRVERWVNRVLDHQTSIIEANKTNLAKQKIQGERPNPTPSIIPTEKENISTKKVNLSEDELEKLKQAFGAFGSANSTRFSCPKCDYLNSDEGAMKDHLETELDKIRWRCSVCWTNSQNFHEAQLHSKTCKRSGLVSRPVEAVRDPNIRASWVACVLETQKQAIKDTPEPMLEQIPTGPPENSLLVVRYEERVPTPEEEMINKRKRRAPVSTASSPDSDDERLIIDELNKEDAETSKKKEAIRKCLYCTYSTKYQQALDYHILRHYKLKPITCMNCNLTFQNKTSTLTIHQKQAHPTLPLEFEKTKVPSGPPLVYDIAIYPGRKRSSASTDEPAVPQEVKPSKLKEEVKKDDGPKLVCLTCEKSMPEIETLKHKHDKQTFFARKGEVIVKCCICLSLFPNVNVLQEHNLHSHSNIPINYAYFKLHYDTREIHQCGHCSKRFKFFRDLKVHHYGVHASLQLKYESKPYIPGAYDIENEERGESSEKADDDGTSLAGTSAKM